MSKKSKSSGSNPSTRNAVFWIIGLCAFISFMITGIMWMLQLIPGLTIPYLDQIKNIANLILTIAAFFAGWVWLISCKMNRKLKLVLKIMFCIFAVAAILGIFGLGI